LTDEAARELLAAFIQVLETVERQNTAIRALVLAHENERRPAADMIQQYREQCDSTEERVRTLRSMLATLSRQL
jgi:hypothetical protein